MSPQSPPFTITSAILNQVAAISEQLGQLSATGKLTQNLRLRRLNRIRTVQGSLAIEGNTLSEEQITAVLEGKRVVAPAKDILEAQNALVVYERFDEWQALDEQSLLAAHGKLMAGLADDAGRYRSGGAGVMSGDQVIHMAPQADRVPSLMGQLFAWLGQTDAQPLIASSVFHYEFEFIHPFSDGNGRMGRLWQSLILAHWNPLLALLPVESLVHAHQVEYYAAINRSTQAGDSAAFIGFMLEVIQTALRDALSADGGHTQQVGQQVTQQVNPQVKALLAVLDGEMSRQELMQQLGLKDRNSFSQRYLQPALAAGLVEMTLPSKPNSRLQRYRKRSH